MYRFSVSKSLVLVSVLATGAPALSQSFNLDIGAQQAGIPTNAYGAGASQPGVWNDVPSNTGGLALFDLSGALTNVSFTSSGAGGDYWSDNVATTGDDEALLDDFTDVGCALGSSYAYTISGLADDDYEIYTYGWASDGDGFRTDITVTGSPDPLQSIGGTWTGTHAQGLTYALHHVTVSGGADVNIQAVTSANCGSLNGFQIKGSSGPVGSNFCVSTVNSTGAASTISGTGSSSISSNSLVLTADNLPGQPGIFIAGPTQAQVPFFNGFLCISPQGLQRFQSVGSPVGGSISEAVDYGTSAAGGLNVAAGASYHYQRWNRDPAGGGGSANFSDGLEVAHTP